MKRLLVVLISLCLSVAVQAQETEPTDTNLYLVQKTDGAEFYGYILKDDGREILLKTLNIGNIYINKSDIRSIKVADKNVKVIEGSGVYSEFRDQGPFTTRYYFTTNAFPIEEKENYAMIHLWGPEIHFGVTEKFSVGVMSSWIASPIGVAAKYNLVSEEDFALAAGTIVGSSGYLLNAQGFFGLHWLTATKGDRMKNISFSAGYSYANLSDWIEIGPKYAINDYSWNPETKDYEYRYPIDSYSAEEALRRKLTGSPYGNTYWNQGTVGAAVIGVGGIAPVGKKASFIFDAMGFIGNRPDVEYTDMDVNVWYEEYDPRIGQTRDVNGTFTIGVGSPTAKTPFVNLVLMPGMRFTQSYDKAFQVALAGIIHFEPGQDPIPIPIPMISWFRQF
jgi:hypothetical protein